MTLFCKKEQSHEALKYIFVSALIWNSNSSDDPSFSTEINQKEQVTNCVFFSVDECVFHWRRSFGQVREGTSSVTTDKPQMLMCTAVTLSLITLQLCAMCPASTAVNVAVCLYVWVHCVSACFCLPLNACGWVRACVRLNVYHHRCFIFWFYTHLIRIYLFFLCCRVHAACVIKKRKKKDPFVSGDIFPIVIWSVNMTAISFFSTSWMCVTRG